LDPVECLQKLEGRIISLHMKDLDKRGVRNAHDVPWGTGNCNVAGVLHELHRQGFKGVFSAEYEHNWENNLPEVKESMDYFKRVASQFQ
jgi:sugar phosphate isomerase/epimerase